jgi:hypothetical protein
MRTRLEQSQMFMDRAQVFEQKASQERDRKLKETLLALAQQYRRLAEQATIGPYE